MILDRKETPEVTPAEERPAYSFHQMTETGVLWLINRVVFHPRGFSLALDYAEGEKEPRGWSIEGFDDPVSFALPEGLEDARFYAIEALLAEAVETGRVPKYALEEDEESNAEGRSDSGRDEADHQGAG